MYNHYMKIQLRITLAALAILVVFPTPVAFAQQKPTCVLQANPGSVPLGGTSNLSWDSSGATSCTITSINNCTVPSGIQGVIPTGNGTTYTGTFTGPGGTITCSTRVNTTLSSGFIPVSGGTTGGTSGGTTGGTPTGGTEPGESGGTVTGGTNQSPAPSVQFGSYPAVGGTEAPVQQAPSVNYTSLGNTSTGGGASPAPQGASGGTGLVPCTGINCQFCNLAQLIQNIINWAIGISIPIAMVLFAYAGFMYATSGGSGENISKAKGIFSTVGIGFLLALGGWLVINTILNIVLANGPYSSGNWFSISCVAQQDRPTSGNPADLLRPLFNVVSGLGGVTVPGNTGGSGTGPVSLCSNTDCSPAVLQAAGFASPSVANAMSCIAMTESSGNTNTQPSSTGACGLFQLTNQTSRSNWQTFINTSQGAGCNYPGSCNDAACNTAGAQWLFAQQGYQPWTGGNPPWNPNARSCVSQYDPSARI